MVVPRDAELAVGKRGLGHEHPGFGLLQNVHLEEELFLDDSWGQVMIGQGIMPDGWSPLADNVPGEDIGPFLDSLAKSYRVKAESLPSHRQFVTAMVGDPVKETQ